MEAANKSIKSKRKFSNHFHDILRLFDVLSNFPFTKKVKRCAIITYKHGMCELPHELPKHLRPRKVSKLHRMIAYCPVFLPKSKFCQY